MTARKKANNKWDVKYLGIVEKPMKTYPPESALYLVYDIISSDKRRYRVFLMMSRQTAPSKLVDDIYEYNDGCWDLVHDIELTEKILDAIHKWGCNSEKIHT